MNVIAASLFARFASRQDDSPAMKAIAAMRNQFGGHAVKSEAPPQGVGPDPDPT
jgi:6-phosphogluconate dehydrogenase